MRFLSLCVSRTSSNISPLLANWCHSASLAIFDEKLCSRANRCEKLVSRSAVMCAVADR